MVSSAGSPRKISIVRRGHGPVQAERRQPHQGHQQTDGHAARESEGREDEGVLGCLGEDLGELIGCQVGPEQGILDPRPVDRERERDDDRRGEGVRDHASGTLSLAGSQASAGEPGRRVAPGSGR